MGTTKPGLCPACNRFIGPLEECPFCDCPSERRAGLFWLRLAALLVATLGLLLLALSVYRREPPPLASGDIRPSMNFAQVRMNGLTAGRPRSGATRSGERWFNVTLDDGTGRVRLSAYGPAAETLASTVTESGMPVRVSGVLMVRAGQMPSLQVADAADVRTGDEP